MIANGKVSKEFLTDSVEKRGQRLFRIDEVYRKVKSSNRENVRRAVEKHINEINKKRKRVIRTLNEASPDEVNEVTKRLGGKDFTNMVHRRKKTAAKLYNKLEKEIKRMGKNPVLNVHFRNPQHAPFGATIGIEEEDSCWSYILKEGFTLEILVHGPRGGLWWIPYFADSYEQFKRDWQSEDKESYEPNSFAHPSAFDFNDTVNLPVAVSYKANTREEAKLLEQYVSSTE